MKSISVKGKNNGMLEPRCYLTYCLRKLWIIPQRDMFSSVLYLSPWINWRTLKDVSRSRRDQAHMCCLLEKAKYSEVYLSSEIRFWHCGFRANYENRFFRPRTDLFPWSAHVAQVCQTWWSVTMWLMKDDSFSGQLHFCMKAEESFFSLPYVYIFGDTHEENEDQN